jgi:hypothetical protein
VYREWEDIEISCVSNARVAVRYAFQELSSPSLHWNLEVVLIFHEPRMLDLKWTPYYILHTWDGSWVKTNDVWVLVVDLWKLPTYLLLNLQPYSYSTLTYQGITFKYPSTIIHHSLVKVKPKMFLYQQITLVKTIICKVEGQELMWHYTFSTLQEYFGVICEAHQSSHATGGYKT